jgi:hypothetical protein
MRLQDRRILSQRRQDPEVINRSSDRQLPRRIHGLPTRQVVILDVPHPPVELVTIAATRRPVRLAGRTLRVPVAMESRGVTVNDGRSRIDLTCGIRIGSRLSGPLGRAPSSGPLGPHPGHERPDRSG